ncbi:hypothetical protein EC973_002893 [Apophysomyces ossiformis]|uniref:Uncharacterized protein n=1 Tax=Apophysomyces ossiformis TaxID=679940 RepID=A0A8H7ELE6_9FUNG|nr:hypothetical protein EC973_002893 [Apophysomyces ossiformis]
MRIAIIKKAFAENRLGFEVLYTSNVNEETFSKLPLLVKLGVENWIQQDQDIGEHDNVMQLKIDDGEAFVKLIVKPIATFSSVQFALSLKLATSFIVFWNAM